MNTYQGSGQQMTHFGTNTKKISCQCDADETSCEVITIQMNSRCPICNSLYQISIPKSTIIAREPQTSSDISLDRLLSEQLVYRASDWETGVLAL